MNPDNLYYIIAAIQRRKWEASIRPTHVLYIRDLLGACAGHSQQEIKAALRNLLDAGRIEAGRTINDTYIKVKKL